MPFSVSEHAATDQPLKIGGIIGYQTFTESACDRPAAMRWDVSIPLGQRLPGSTVAIVWNEIL